MFGVPRSVLIVEANGCGKYAKQLYNLIGTNDNKEGEDVGKVDRSVEASIFNEKQFEATPITSEQLVVFVGRPKVAEDYIDAIREESATGVDEAGVHIHVSGKQAFVDVERGRTSRSDYEKFLEFACSHGQKLENLLGDEPENNEDAEAMDSFSNPLEAAAGLLGHTARILENKGRYIGDWASVALKAREVENQRFRFAVKLFYREMLKDFVVA